MATRLGPVTVTVLVLGAALWLPAPAFAQSGQVSGYVRDSSAQVIANATVTARYLATDQVRSVRTNGFGLYVLSSLVPGRYSLAVDAPGFESILLPLQIEAGYAAGLDVRLQVAGVTEAVSVESDPPLLGSRDGSVGTIVDRRLAESLPLSGHTFHALIELAPGVTRAPGGGYAVSGQRTDGNYFQVDGVSAQTGVGVVSFEGAGVGQLPATIATGGYNGLASVDALREIRIQTSSAAPEYGRGPGAQVSIVTRAGSNVLQGSLFDYVRNDALDANNWFVNYRGLPHQELRQQNFGGVLGGPIKRSRLFYFASYEGLRVRQPRVVVGNVPSRAARAAANTALQPYLDVFPAPTGPDVGLVAEYAASASDKISADVASGRVDFSTSRLQLFARYSHAPSSIASQSVGFAAVNEPTLRGGTAGATYIMGPRLLADVRINYTANASPVFYEPQSWPGTEPFPSATVPIDADGTLFSFRIGTARFVFGPNASNRLRQANVTGSLTWVAGRGHTLKFGTDYRHLSSRYAYVPLQLSSAFTSLAQLQSAQASSLQLTQTDSTRAMYENVSVFGQDGWRVNPRLSVTYGLRWDVNPAPSYPPGHEPLAAVHFDELSQLNYASRGTPLWRTRYGNVAPRLGASYDLAGDGSTIVTGAIGVYYDLGTQASGSVIDFSNYPLAARQLKTGVQFPLTSSDVAAAARPPVAPPYAGVIAYLLDPDMETPRTMQWNVRVERQLPGSQSVSIGYVGARGEHLVSTASYLSPNALFPGSAVRLLSGAAHSRYQALQAQYRRRTTHGVEAQVGYTFSRSMDDASQNAAVQTPGTSTVQNDYGPSSFDTRHVLTAAAAWLLPAPSRSKFVTAAFGGWSVDVLARARSAQPLTLWVGQDLLGTGDSFATRPDVTGAPFWIDDPDAPGGRRLNRDAFAAPPVGRQGTLGRNALRGFKAAQVDFGLRRTVGLGGSRRLLIAVELFNLLNEPMFADPDPDLSSATFGRSIQTYNVNTGSFTIDPSTLYQWGGPRSVQLGLKLQF